MPSYTEEQKRKAVETVEECGGSVTRAIRRLGYPSRQTMYQWLNQRDASHERRAGRPWSPDNSAMEGFFGRLKNEFFHHRDWSGVSIPEFCRMLDSYLRHYDEGRPKEGLGWMSPMQYRRSLGLAA